MLTTRDIAKIIKHARTSRDLSRAAVAKKAKLSETTLYAFESGRSSINLDTLLSLCRVLGLELSIDLHKISALNMSLSFDKLDEHGKDVVTTIMNKEIERIESEEKPSVAETKPVILFDLPASAGLATPNDLDDYNIETLPAEEVGDCKYAVRISGGSMEPIIHDDDIVCFCQTTDLSNGDIGVFSVNGEIVCKHYYMDSDRNIYLVSHNEKYKKTNIYISCDSDYSFKAYGRVYGKSADLPKYFLDSLEQD